MGTARTGDRIELEERKALLQKAGHLVPAIGGRALGGTRTEGPEAGTEAQSHLKCRYWQVRGLYL